MENGTGNNGRKPQMDFSKLEETINNLAASYEPDAPPSWVEINTLDLDKVLTYLHWLRTFLEDRRTSHAKYNKKKNALAKEMESRLSPDEIEELDRQIEAELGRRRSR